MQSPDMIKIATDDGRFKFIKEAQVELVHEFIQKPWTFDYNKENIKILYEAYKIMDEFMNTLEPKSIAWIYYCSEDGMKSDRVLLVSKDYTQDTINNFKKLIH